jgi:alkylhydroperoxidase family enzyme
VTAFIAPPPRIPWYLRLGLRVARRRSGRDLLPAQLLAWYPRAAVSSAVLESLVAHHDGRLDARLLKLVRMAVSFTVECPFCVGLNSEGWEAVISAPELAAVQGSSSLELFPRRERVAIEYARLASATPLAIPSAFGATLREAFTDREIVVLATTIAQVNYWARLVQALGCPPEG